ncbi:hypothetical protein GCM10023067_22770 [Aminobacter aganoensis]
MELLDELVLVEVLVDELVPELLWESLSVVQLPLEQLLERELDLLVDLETVTDLLPIRIGAPEAAAGVMAGPGPASGPAWAAETVRAVPAKIAAAAKRWNLAIADAPLRGTKTPFEHGAAGRVNSSIGARRVRTATAPRLVAVAASGRAVARKRVEIERDVDGRAEDSAGQMVAFGQRETDRRFLVGKDAADQSLLVADHPMALGIAADHEAMRRGDGMDVASQCAHDVLPFFRCGCADCRL